MEDKMQIKEFRDITKTPLIENDTTQVSIRKYVRCYGWSITLSDKSTKEDLDRIIDLLHYTDQRIASEFKTEDQLQEEEYQKSKIQDQSE